MKIKYFILTIAVILIGVFMSFGVHAQESAFPIDVKEARFGDGYVFVTLNSVEDFENDLVGVLTLYDVQGNVLNYHTEPISVGKGVNDPVLILTAEQSVMDKKVDHLKFYILQDFSSVVPLCSPVDIDREQVTYTLFYAPSLRDVSPQSNMSDYITRTHLGENTSYSLVVNAVPEMGAGVVTQIEGRLFITKDSDGGSTYVQCPRYNREEFQSDSLGTITHTFVLDDLINSETKGTAYNYSFINRSDYTITIYDWALFQVGGYAD